MTTETRNDFEVRNERGVALYTSNSRELACQWAKRRTRQLPGVQLIVEHVTVTVIEDRQPVYRPRPFVQESAA